MQKLLQFVQSFFVSLTSSSNYCDFSTADYNDRLKNNSINYSFVKENLN